MAGDPLNSCLLSKSALASALMLALTGLSSRPAFSQQPAALSEAEAEALIGPLYAALNTPSADMIQPMLEQATSADWQDCGANDACDSRPEAIQHLHQRIAVVPGIKVERKEVIVMGNRIVVRGEEYGTPVAPFLGVQPSGRSFRVMTIDIHEVVRGRIARTYHVENWGAAVRQLSGDAP